jgi:hypothetical protein
MAQRFLVVAYSGLLALASSAACSKAPAKQSGTGEQRLDFPGEPPTPAAVQLTEEKLQSFLGYQRRMLGLYAERIDGGEPRREADISRLALIEADARQRSGLQRTELASIQEMVRQVIGKRVHGGDPPGDDSLERMKTLQAKLGPGRGSELAKNIAQLESDRDEFSRLVEERQKFGDANVNLLLAHEAELIRNWKETMAVFSDPEPKRR